MSLASYSKGCSRSTCLADLPLAYLIVGSSRSLFLVPVEVLGVDILKSLIAKVLPRGAVPWLGPG
jgi:hypothetical protein